MRGCMPNTAGPGPAHADYSASRLSDSSPSRGLPLLLPSVRHRLSDSSPSPGLPLLLPFVRHRLSDSSPFRGLPLSALVRHQRSVSSATRPFPPFVRHQRSFSSASRGWQPLLPIHGTTAARGSGGATALPHLVQAPGTECALQLARCASGSCTVYSVSRYASAICPLSGCTSAPYLDRCMGPLRMALGPITLWDPGPERRAAARAWLPLSLPPHLQRSYTRGVIPPSPAIHTRGENYESRREAQRS